VFLLYRYSQSMRLDLDFDIIRYLLAPDRDLRISSTYFNFSIIFLIVAAPKPPIFVAAIVSQLSNFWAG
jgi:hypothetical protein